MVCILPLFLNNDQQHQQILVRMLFTNCLFIQKTSACWV